MLNIVIVEGDIQTNEFIIGILESQCSDVNVKGIATDITSALQLIPNLKPDLVLFDIDFLEEEIFYILEELNTINFKSIFITAQDKLAIRALKLDVFDYLIKPINSDELIHAIEKAKLISNVEEKGVEINSTRNNFNPNLYISDKIVLKTLESIYFVDIKDIIRCESGGSYTYFYMKNGKKITTSRLLKQYDELLQNQGFIRVHQSHLINLNYIDMFDKKNGGILIMKDGSAVPVSFRKKESFFKLIDEF